MEETINRAIRQTVEHSSRALSNNHCTHQQDCHYQVDSSDNGEDQHTPHPTKTTGYSSSVTFMLSHGKGE